MFHFNRSIAALAIELILGFVISQVGEQVIPDVPAPLPPPTRHCKLETTKLTFDVPEPTNELIELENRIIIARTYWAAGAASDNHRMRCTAIGCLDSSIPVPNLPVKPGSVKNHFSKYGSLLQLLDAADKNGGHISSNYTAEEWIRLCELAGTKRNKGTPYLCVTTPQGDELFALLAKAFPQDQ